MICKYGAKTGAPKQPPNEWGMYMPGAMATWHKQYLDYRRRITDREELFYYHLDYLGEVQE